VSHVTATERERREREREEEEEESKKDEPMVDRRFWPVRSNFEVLHFV